MKKLALLLAVCLLLTVFAGCDGAQTPAGTEATTEPSTAATTQATTEATTEATTQATTQPVIAGPQVMDLVGNWQRTHTEVEGDRNQNTNATITITGVGEDGLTVTYQDTEFPNDNFSDKALTIKEGEIYSDCGNAVWFADVASTGKYSYSLTLLEDGTLLLQTGFDYDGLPMVSYQWFARSE